MSARLPGLDIGYRAGTGGQLPAPDSASGLAYCRDVPEHVSGLDRVVTETVRALKPGGLGLSGTINRTQTSKLLAITVLQQWPMTRLTDAVIHDGDMIIRPAGLAGVLERPGLQPGEMADLGPRGKLPVVLGSLSPRRGRISYGNPAGRQRPARGCAPRPGQPHPGSATTVPCARPAGCARHPQPDSGPHEARA
jgi:2-polyprenyl-6-hydroxyphenyl methylase/3-demethylubiquinone-9 3-methyltransferase